MDEQQRFCPSCGMPNAPDAAFCATCGRPLADQQPSDRAPAAGSPPVGSSGALPPPPAFAQPAPPPPPSMPPSPPVAQPPPPAPPVLPGRPVPMAPVPFPAAEPALTSGQKTGQFFGGVGLGLAGFAAIVILTILTNQVAYSLAAGNGTNITPYVAIVLFLALIGVMAYLLAKPRVRWLGYGVLAAIVALPVIAVVGCIVILSVSFRSA